MQVEKMEASSHLGPQDYILWVIDEIFGVPKINHSRVKIVLKQTIRLEREIMDVFDIILT